jgi:hypothetical protein
MPYFLSDPKLLNNLNESVLDSAVAGNHLKLVKRYYSDRTLTVLSNGIFILQLCFFDHKHISLTLKLDIFYYYMTTLSHIRICKCTFDIITHRLSL